VESIDVGRAAALSEVSGGVVRMTRPAAIGSWGEELRSWRCVAQPGVMSVPERRRSSRARFGALLRRLSCKRLSVQCICS
jgi:hypothetical protein